MKHFEGNPLTDYDLSSIRNDEWCGEDIKTLSTLIECRAFVCNPVFAELRETMSGQTTIL